MSPIFNKLPLELRTDIYQELLTDDFHYLEPLGRNRHDKSIKKELHTPILRVCKQAYAEASTVLYEKNTFRFECPRRCIECRVIDLFPKGRPPKGAFHRIQNVIISFGLWETFPQHICENAKNIMVVVKYIAGLRCSLKTLLVDFKLHDPTRIQINLSMAYIDELESASTKIANSLDLSKALAKLEVKNQIEVAIDSEKEDDCKNLANFVNKVGHLKQWVPELIESGADVEGGTEMEDDVDMEEDYGGQDEPSSINNDGTGQQSDANVSGLNSDSPWDSDEEDFEDVMESFDSSFFPEYTNPTRFRRAWTLRPATAANRKDVERNFGCGTKERPYEV